jgi:vacuolar-type H+-ATPase subunit E/Vma4
MAFKKGEVTNPNGRAKGVPNKATQEAREAIAKFVDGNAHKLQEWLDKIAEDNPTKAFELFQSVIEYHVPKLSRADNNLAVTGVTINWALPQTGLDG